MPNFKLTSRHLPDLWFYVVAAVIILLAGMMVYANAASGFGTDAFVRMIEQRQGMYPGGTKVLPDCGCTIKYLGTKIEGHVYAVYLDKLD